MKGKGKNKGRGDGKGGGPKRKRVAPAAGNEEPPPTVVTKQPTRAESKLTKELQASEKVLLDAKHIFDNLQTEESLGLVRSKALQTVADRVKGRLSTALVNLYSTGFDPLAPEETAKMKVLQNLRAVQRSVQLVTPLVSALSDEKVPGHELWAAAKAATTDTFAPCAKLVEIALQRDLEKASKDGNFDAMLALLGVGADAGRPAAEAAFNVYLLNTADKRTAFQEREIFRLLAELMRGDGQIENLAKMTSAIVKAQIFLDDSPVMSELLDLSKILRPKDDDVKPQELQDLVQRFRTDPGLRLHKVLCNFTTGLEVLEQASKAALDRIKNETLIGRLDKLQQELQDLPALVLNETSMEELEKLVEPYKPASVEFAAIKGEANADFVDSYKAVMDGVAGKIKAC